MIVKTITTDQIQPNVTQNINLKPVSNGNSWPCLLFITGRGTNAENLIMYVATRYGVYNNRWEKIANQCYNSNNSLEAVLKFSGSTDPNTWTFSVDVIPKGVQQTIRIVTVSVIA